MNSRKQPPECTHPYLIVVNIFEHQCELKCANRKCNHTLKLPSSTFEEHPYPGTIKCYEGYKIDGFQIFVHGEPAPQGSKRHVGNGIMIESSKKVAPWRQEVASTASQLLPLLKWQITTAPVRVDICFWLPAPKSNNRLFPSTKPDLDKLLRSTLDGLTLSNAAYVDDAQVTDGSVRKRYALPGKPIGADITISLVERQEK